MCLQSKAKSGHEQVKSPSRSHCDGWLQICAPVLSRAAAARFHQRAQSGQVVTEDRHRALEDRDRIQEVPLECAGHRDRHASRSRRPSDHKRSKGMAQNVKAVRQAEIATSGSTPPQL